MTTERSPDSSTADQRLRNCFLRLLSDVSSVPNWKSPKRNPSVMRRHLEQLVSATPADLKWGERPGLWKIAVLYGNPNEEGPFIVRAKFPANYEIPLHWHPATEFITILSGTVYLAFGKGADRSTATAYPAGSFAALPAHMPIRGWTEEEAVVQVHSSGPLETVLMEPSDRPGPVLWVHPAWRQDSHHASNRSARRRSGPKGGVSSSS